jgi:preprotein translocase subunit SecE
MKDLTQTDRGKTISFFNELDTETRTMLITSVSFFNKVSTKTQKLSSDVVSFFNKLEIKKPCSKTSVSFFNELEIKKPCSKTSVSFFNEVASEMQKTILVTSVSFFNEVAAEMQKTILGWFHFLTRLLQASFRWLLAPTHTLARSLYEEGPISLDRLARASKLLFKLGPSHNSFTNSPMNLA